MIFSDSAVCRLSLMESVCTREKTPSFCVDVEPGHRNWFFCPAITQSLLSDIDEVVLSIKENLQIALSENLLPYLVCLSWHLNSDEKEKLSTSLANFHSVSVPSLKVTAKSVLATVYGFDMVSNL